jgi:hypothetical protein
VINGNGNGNGNGRREGAGGVGWWRRVRGLVIADRKRVHVKVTGSRRRRYSVSTGGRHRLNGRANSGGTGAGAVVDGWWPDATVRGRASCTPLQLGKAWGNGWSQ